MWDMCGSVVVKCVCICTTTFIMRAFAFVAIDGGATTFVKCRQLKGTNICAIWDKYMLTVCIRIHVSSRI